MPGAMVALELPQKKATGEAMKRARDSSNALIDWYASEAMSPSPWDNVPLVTRAYYAVSV